MTISLPEARSVVALRRGLAILDVYSGGQEELGVNEIARALDMHKSTVSRLCSTLEQAGYLARDEVTDKYRLGARIRQLIGASSRDVELRTAARDVLRQLVETAGETVTMVVRDGLDITTIEVMDGPSLVRMQARVGARTQVHASAGAKAVLAWLPDDMLGPIIDAWPLARLTPNTITRKDELIRHLASLRERGYSIDNEEMEIGLRCVGAPVRDQTGGVIAAIAISAPRFRLNDEDFDRFGLMARQAADAISSRLGAPSVGHGVPATRQAGSRRRSSR
jgi:IclR family KDG regulon transcriptional repressor